MTKVIVRKFSVKSSKGFSFNIDHFFAVLSSAVNYLLRMFLYWPPLTKIQL